MNNGFWKNAENLFAAVCLVLSVLALAFSGWLVGPTKMLFGEPLTAITPGIFPRIVIAFLAVLSILHLVLAARKNEDYEDEVGIVGWRRGIVFFGILTVYGLILEPVGFIISSALTLTVLSWYVGNRSIIQIALVATISPVLLYLAATRLLAVSLPELNFIELAIARILS